jgi:hypothetical protein
MVLFYLQLSYLLETAERGLDGMFLGFSQLLYRLHLPPHLHPSLRDAFPALKDRLLSHRVLTTKLLQEGLYGTDDGIIRLSPRKKQLVFLEPALDKARVQFR